MRPSASLVVIGPVLVMICHSGRRDQVRLGERAVVFSRRRLLRYRRDGEENEPESNQQAAAGSGENDHDFARSFGIDACCWAIDASDQRVGISGRLAGLGFKQIAACLFEQRRL